MTTISGISSAALTYTPTYTPAPAPAPSPREEPVLTSTREAERQERLGRLLETDVAGKSASDLVAKLQERGIGFDQMRAQLSSGDLLDVRA